RPPQNPTRNTAFRNPEPRQVSDHQSENQKRDQARFRRQRFQPLRPYNEPAKSQRRNRHGDSYGKHAGKPKIKPREAAIGQKSQPESCGEMVNRHQRENAEAPKYKRMRQPRQRPLGDYLSLRGNLPQHSPDARANRPQLEVGVRLRCQDDAQRQAKFPPKQKQRNADSNQQDDSSRPVHTGTPPDDPTV